jgi:hypothetical protein
MHRPAPSNLPVVEAYFVAYGVAAPEHRVVAFDRSTTPPESPLRTVHEHWMPHRDRDREPRCTTPCSPKLGRDETGSIVLFSRGTDDASRISEQQLLPEFRARAGPKIRVVAVRIGPAPAAAQADPLRDLADASGGDGRTPPAAAESCAAGATAGSRPGDPSARDSPRRCRATAAHCPAPMHTLVRLERDALVESGSTSAR